MANPFDPPADYAPPADWVDPLKVDEPEQPVVDPPGYVRNVHADTVEEILNPAHPEEDCEPCRKKRARARALGAGIGVLIGGAMVLAVVYLVKGPNVES